MNIPTQSNKDIFQKYSAALEWMKEIGVNLNLGRTQHYRKILEFSIKIKNDEIRKESEKNAFPDYVSSMLEIHDFINIYDAFYSTPKNQLAHIVAKLQEGVNGPINANDETEKSTKARNFLFEAIVAAKAHRPIKGIEAILDAESDTGIGIDKKKLWIECKRITSMGKIEANVRTASNQLESIINKHYGSGHRGIVALEITKLINPENEIYVTQNDSHLAASSNALMDRFIEDYSEIWQKLYKRKNKKIIGTIIRFALISSSEARKILVYTSQWAMNPRRGISDSDINIQKLLVSNLNEIS